MHDMPFINCAYIVPVTSSHCPCTLLSGRGGIGSRPVQPYTRRHRLAAGTGGCWPATAHSWPQAGLHGTSARRRAAQ